MYPLIFNVSDRPRPLLPSQRILDQRNLLCLFRVLDQHFGLGLSPEDVLTLIARPHRGGHYYRPWRTQTANRDSGSSIKQDRNKYQVDLDVQHFAPDEITVKTADGFLIVEAKHEEHRDEHGFITRSFTRRYQLPEGVLEDSIISKVSSDGVLTITAPLKALSASTNERVVPIVQTGPVNQQAEERQGY